MCGFAGFLGNTPDPYDVLLRMGRSIQHRGPDHQDQWFCDRSSLGLVHVRLSILDLSSAGSQPMLSSCGRYRIAFNGEIYNHLELRELLSGYDVHWRGHSDTESLLEFICYFGLSKALEACRGMFAFALYDSKLETLYLVRDRLGEKPLYFGRIGNSICFGSELHALRQYPGFTNDIDEHSLACFLRLRYVPDSRCIYRNVYKVQPGTYVKICTKTLGSSSISYYQPPTPSVQSRSIGNPRLADYIDRAGLVLSEAVALQMSADVPLGVFLSGGIDSSLITSLMQEVSDRPVNSFTVTFDDEKFNEGEHAATVAKLLGTNHSEVLVTGADALNVIEDLPDIYDEPFADSSQIPTILLCRAARKQMTVCLTGDGADELFAGYTRYARTMDMWKKVKVFPLEWRRKFVDLVFSGITKQSRVLDAGSKLIPRKSMFPFSPTDRLLKFKDSLVSEDRQSFYKNLFLYNKFDCSLMGAALPAPEFNNQFNLSEDMFLEEMMCLDRSNYLPGDILVKVDRAAMACSLETRAPFLDPLVVDFAATISGELHTSGGCGKQVLRELLYRKLPKEIIDKPKRGFTVPLNQWLNNELKELIDVLLSDAALEEHNLFDKAVVRQMLEQHQFGYRDWKSEIWTLLMFQIWYRNQKSSV